MFRRISDADCHPRETGTVIQWDIVQMSRCCTGEGGAMALQRRLLLLPQQANFYNAEQQSTEPQISTKSLRVSIITEQQTLGTPKHITQSLSG